MYLIPSAPKIKSQRPAKMFAFWKPERQHMKVLFHPFPEYLSGLPVVPAVTGAQSKKRFCNRSRLRCKLISHFSHRTHRYNCNLIICNSYGFGMVPPAILITESQSVTLEFG